MKTHTHKIIKSAAILFAALTLLLSIGACANRDKEERETSAHTHAPGTPPHTH
jgi:hypothetical protein